MTLFERIRTLIGLGVVDTWQQMYHFIGSPMSRLPPTAGRWLIA